MELEFLEEIYSQYYKSIYNYISFRINNHFDTEELASTVFEKAIRNSGTYKSGISTAEAWLIGIAKNVVTDYLRGKKRREFVSLDDVLDFVSPWSHGQPEEVIVKSEDNRALITAMAALQ
jgi:RNA polymerase sigma-70 factor (ECF subfamily)